MEKRPIYSESSSATESDSNEEEDEESETDGMVIDEQDSLMTAPSPKIVPESKQTTTYKQKETKTKSTHQVSRPKKLIKRESDGTKGTVSSRSVVKSAENKEMASSPSTSISGSPKSSSTKKKQATRNLMLTGRGVTTQMLIEEQILEPGNDNLSINYLGRKFGGDLISDGTIMCHTANHIFSSPSAWAMHCKKQVNPDKKSGCGWASVKYKGRKLDEFKSTWFRKQKIEQQVAASSENDSLASSSHNDYGFKSKKLESLSKELAENSRPSPGYVPPTDKFLTFSEALKAVHSRQPSAHMSKMKIDPNSHQIFYSEIQQKNRKKTHRTRISVKHSNLQSNSDPTTLVECAQFTSTGKIQPFSITISTSALLLIDFHCHLTTTEVSGYLAGKWDVSRQHIRVTQAFPCRYTSSCNDVKIEFAENRIRKCIEEQGLRLVGWYHSHPFWQPDPSICDIRSQIDYQRTLKDGHYEPCVGLIVSPYDSYRRESQFNAFWVREPKDGKFSAIGLPLLMKFTTQQDQELTQDLVNEMVALVNFYQGTSDVVKFSEIWSADSSYLDKLKHSIIRKFPQDQTDGRFLDFIHKMVAAVCS